MSAAEQEALLARGNYCFGGEHLVVPDVSSASAFQNNNNTIFARGTFGELSLAFYTSKPSLQVCAVKTLAQPWQHMKARGDDFSLLQLSQSANAEITALQQLSSHQHDNIVKLLAVCVQKESSSSSALSNSLCLALEYSPVDLAMVLEWKRRTCAPLLSMSVIQTMARDVLSGLAHCHLHGILHRDVKPGNLLIFSCGRLSGHVKLCDFGLAYRCHKTKTETDDTEYADDQALGTLFYRPPEVLLGQRAVHPAVDVYAAGVTIAEMIQTGRPLFAGTSNDLSQLQQIFQGLGTPTPTSWPTVHEMPDWGKLHFTEQPPLLWETLLPRAADESPALSRLLQSMIQLDPLQRPTVLECVDRFRYHDNHDDDMEDEDDALIITKISEQQARDELVRECIPIELLPPLLLDEKALPHERLVALAKARRNFLGSLETWNDK